MNPRVKFLICIPAILLFAQSSSLVAQSFTEQSNINLPPVVRASTDWGDYDNDGDLDLLLYGYNIDEGYILQIYRNDGSNVFSEQPDITSDYFYYGSACWVDYDNDGNLDVFVTGRSYDDFSKLYRNNGDNTFTVQNQIQFKAVYYESYDWGDFDNDGDLDLLIGGSTDNQGFVTEIYRNNGDHSFTELDGLQLHGIEDGCSNWIDYDQDGDLDFLLTGATSFYPEFFSVTSLYRNNGDNSFTLLDTYDFTGVTTSATAWGDYDNDGYPDLLLIGWTDLEESVSLLYHNDSGAGFSLATQFNVEGMYYGDVDWGDYNNDGFTDILMAGSGRVRLYMNNGGTGFTALDDLPQDSIYLPSIKWFDYDNDGDLDYMLTGNDEELDIIITKIYRNNTLSSNTAPSVPAGTYEMVDGNTVTLHWNETSDTQTAQAALNYNLMIGTSSEGIDICAPDADIGTGFRKHVKAGPVQGNSWSIRNLEPGNYYWRVQAIDQAYAGSGFSGNESFSVELGNSISPVEEQELLPETAGIPIIVSETSVPDNRQWKYSLTAGGPYDHNITGATGNTYTPEFSGFGSYYIVCVSNWSGSHITSNEVLVNVPQFTHQDHIYLGSRLQESIQWGDYDNDGYLDILLLQYSSSSNTPVYKNNTDNTFTRQVHIELPYVTDGSSTWGDYDNDGDLDILIAGKQSPENITISRIYRNNGDNTFTAQTAIELTGVSSNSMVWEDTDNDGDLDIILAGADASENQVCKLYRYDGNNNYTEVQPGIVPFFQGEMLAADYDLDGYTDLLITGTDFGGNKITKIYRNEHNNTFSDMGPSGLPVVQNASAEWGDYDNDGDPDVLISGRVYGNTYVCVAGIYRNNGDLSFTKLAGIDLEGVELGSVTWADRDNDGDLDVFLSGFSYARGHYSSLYTNNGDHTFTEQYPAFLPAFQDVMPDWGDYDNDGDLDLILSGTDLVHTYPKVFRNNILAHNHPPSVPGQMASSVFAGGATLSWDKSTDSETPADGLGYNLSISRDRDSSDILSPMSDLDNGYRRIPDKGNARQNSYTITGLDTGQFYWRVQAVDQSYAGSDFSPLDSFTVLPHFTAEDPVIPGVRIGTAVPGDYDADGDMDLLVLGATIGDYRTEIYRNDGGNSFTAIDAGLVGVSYGGANWCDLDNDGDLDLSFSGRQGDETYTKLYLNEGADSFVEQTGTPFLNVYRSALEWGDLDNDGLQDLLLTGYTGKYNSRIYRNNGDLTFSELEGENIVEVSSSSAALGDYDNDMDLDILVNGITYGDLYPDVADYKSTTRIYRNDGHGIFRDIEAGLHGLRAGLLDWGDYDNDGDLDFVVSGEEYGGDRFTKIYRNDGNDQFTDIQALIRGAVESEMQWGDYDNDGDLDLLFEGESATNVMEIFRNDGNDIFTEVDAGFDGFYTGSLTWIDHDGDRDLDVLATGYFDGQIFTRIYRNNGNWQNARPTAPKYLSSVTLGFGVLLDWEAASDDQTPSQSLSYNLRIGSVSGAMDILTPMSDLSNGNRLVPAMGNCNLNTGWRLDSLAVGTYYWSVQAVDHTFLGGDWAPEQSFTITAVNADFTASSACEGLGTDFTDLSIASGDPVSEWAWDFGDGNHSSVQHPTHIYANAGTYAVQLVATSASFSDTLVQQVTVLPKPYAAFDSEIVCLGSPTPINNLSTLNGTTVSTWTWNFGDGTGSSEQEPGTHPYLSEGEYTVQLTAIADNGCYDISTGTATVAEYPKAVISLVPGYNNTFCSGDSTILAVSQHAGYSYQWQLNHSNIFHETDTSIVVKGPTGTYSILIENQAAGCTASDDIQITMSEYAIVPLIVTENYEEGGCPQEEPVILKVETADMNALYQWKRNGVSINGATGASYSGFLDEGDYRVEARLNNCAVESQALVLSYGAMPEKPEIFVEGPVVWYLACSNNNASTYRWFLNQELIQGADSYIYVAGSQKGSYTVAISEDGSCFAISDAVQIPLNTGMDQDIWENLKIYPNPTPGRFTLEMNNPVMGELILDIFNEGGRKIINIKFQKEIAHFKTEIDLSGQPAAVYLINLRLEQYRASRKLIVE